MASAPAIFSLVWGVIKYVLKEDIVNHAIDNWTKGTSNKVDDWVWAALERAIGVPEEKREEIVVAAIADVQTRYNLAEAAGVLEDLKKDIVILDMADIRYGVPGYTLPDEAVC